MARIYTKRGDDGTTGLLFGSRVSKGGELMDATGDIDEAVSTLGLARAGSEDEKTAELILRIQRDLFVVAADLAVNPKHRDRLQPRISLVVPEMVTELEGIIDTLTAERPLKPVFLVPGSSRTEAELDLCRTVVRRAERHTVQARIAGHTISDIALHYLNRLSDLLYVMARQAVGDGEEPVSHH